MEPELYRMLPKDCTLHTARMRLREVTIKALSAMEKKAVEAAQELSDAEVSAVSYGCTSGSLFRGVGHDRRIEAKLGKIVNAPCVATSRAVVDSLRALQVCNVAVATPYSKEINELEKEFLVGNDFEVVDIRGLGLVDNVEIGKRKPDVAYTLVRQLRYTDADAIFISCTNFRTIEVVERLERETGRPVVSSNTATLWGVIRKAKLEKTIEGFGMLFATSA
jgi:maleate isomerase